MAKRTLWGGLYAASLVGIFAFTAFGTYLIVIFILLLLRELATIQKMESRFPLIILGAFVLGTMVVLGFDTERLPLAGSIVFAVLLSFTLLRSKQPALEIRRGLFAITYVFLPLTYTAQMAAKYSTIILFIFVMIWSSDSFAYLVGRWIGKRPLAPTLSPKKTIEGFAGGVLGTIIVGVVANHFWGLLSLSTAVSMAIAVSICAPFGDLIASAVKREANVKDSGVFLPGHGGALDRLDSFITAAPIGLLLFQLLA